MDINNQNHLLIIKTARSEEAINAAVEQGYWPLVKPVIPSVEIRSKYAVLQNKVTGKISVIHDYRNRAYSMPEDNKKSAISVVIDFTNYYPHHFESPYAAYLIPSDIKVNEAIWVEDLIEDIVGSKWNQGDTYRLKSSEAVWSGTDLIITYKPFGGICAMVG